MPTIDEILRKKRDKFAPDVDLGEQANLGDIALPELKITTGTFPSGTPKGITSPVASIPRPSGEQVSPVAGPNNNKGPAPVTLDPLIEASKEEPTDVNIDVENPILPPGRYSYLDLVIDSDVGIGPDSPLYNLLTSKFARRL